MVRHRESVNAKLFRRRIKNLNVAEVPIAPRSPWQSPFVERMIGSIRRDCLNHVIVLNERHLHRILNSYFDYYHKWRTHLSLDMDCPDERPVQQANDRKVIEIPDVGGLHHHYLRKAA